jgi:hypothetical protein
MLGHAVGDCHLGGEHCAGYTVIWRSRNGESHLEVPLGDLSRAVRYLNDVQVAHHVF